ncbi:NACHT domain protein [Apiospora aurea]|uniref:NACHT domain protein n=1 Tax=Apiospora aurea TaxID=335848 RepID=A0ABR1PWZ8_9PEZI
MAPASVMSGTAQPHTLVGMSMESMMMSNSTTSHRESSSRSVASSSAAMMETPAISSVVYSLKRRSEAELGPGMSAQIMSETHLSILDWIAVQRMSHLPAEGSSYDKVLAWTQLFVERLHAFELATDEFAGGSSLATRVAYGYCAILLKLGKENASGLLTSLGFFYSISTTLADLLERTEMFRVSQEIREHLVLATTDLVTVVASVATHFYKAIRSASNESVSVNIYTTFAEQIKTFRDRCDKIADAMWRHQLLAHDMGAETVADVKSIKSWLAPEDRVLANVTGGGVSLLAQEREELTCLWVAPQLTRYLRGQDKVLSISGKPGCGKTVASSVIVDYLQRPISGVHHSALYVPIDGNVPVETATRAIAKVIMSQLLDKRVGNIQLLQTLRDAYKACQTAATNDEYDDAVWSAMGRALSAGLPGAAREVVLVVDGIDDASCDEKALFQRLVSATGKAGGSVRLITLGRAKMAEAPGQADMQISDALVSDDIMAVVRGHFESDTEFGQMSEFEQESVVSALTEASAGSFLWAKLATKRLRRAVGLNEFRAAVEKMTKAKPAITEFVQQCVHAASMTDEARLMLMWLATAERPLSPKELGALSCVQADKGGALADAGGVDVLATLKPVQGLVMMQHGLMCLRHGLIRDSLRELQGKGQLVPAVKDAHADLATRLLSYIKTVAPEQHEPSVRLLDDHDKAQLLSRYPLLDFAVRHWPVHLTQSKAFESGGDAGAARAFSKVFPTTVTSLRLQATLWQHCPVPLLLSYQATVTTIYRECFTAKSPLTLQCIVYLGIIHRQIGRVDEAADLFFEATTLSGKRRPVDPTLTAQMADYYIQLIEGKTTTSSRKDVLSKLDEVFSILVECYKSKVGQTSSQIVAATLRRLAEHYRSIKEVSKYEQVMESLLYRVEAEPDTGSVVTETDTDLRVQLKGTKETTMTEEGEEEEGGVLHLEVEERDDLIQGSGDSIKEAERCVAEGLIDAAERVYIDAWQRASREYSAHRSIILAEKNLKVALSYSKFLQSQERTSEASALLVSVSEEYTRQSSTTMLTETSASLLVQVAKTVKSMGLTSVSLAISKSCQQYYRSTNRTQTSMYKEIEETIEVTSQKVLKSTDSSSQTVTSEKSREESVFQYSRSITTMRSTAFEQANSLISQYMSQHRWQQATEFMIKVLRGIWPSLLSVSMQDITLVQDHVEDCIDLTSRLAECYSIRRRRIDEGDIRLRVYRALRSGREVDDKPRMDATQALLSFYDRTSQPEPGIAIRQEVLDDLMARHGEQHDTVIQLLWDLAERTRPRPVSVGYYQRIIRAINGDAKTSKPEALKPITFVATELWSRGAFSEALPYYKTLFNTFLTEPKPSPALEDQTLLRECFDRYLGCLRHANIAFSVLHKITTEYQTQCKTVFGASASITIQATLTLARVCQESTTTVSQVMELYEELLQTKTQEINLEEISSDLKIMQEEQTAADMALTSSSNSTNLTSSQIERSVGILRKRFSSVKESRGWAHEESLTQLEELVRFQSMQQHETETITRELREATVSILTTSSKSSPTQLVAAAKTIASSYTTSNQMTQATEMADELYRQLVIKGTSNANSSQIDLSSCGRESLVFLAQLEYSLGRTPATLTEIMAAMVAQYTYFAEFQSLTQSKANDFLEVSKAAARIYQCLESSGRHAASARVFEQYASWVHHADASLLPMAKLSPGQAKILLQAILGHLSTHKSTDMVRTVGIIGNTRVAELLKEERYDEACGLATACFKVIAVKPDYYRTAAMAKLVLTMSMLVGRCATNKKLALAPDARKSLLETSKPILEDVLRIILPADDQSEKSENSNKKINTPKTNTKINLAKLDPAHLHRLLVLLGAQENYPTLSRLLTALWASREAQHDWAPRATFALAGRYILARYVVGDAAAALRVAEHIVYNCRRVHGLCHPATLEMAGLLARLYAGVARRHQERTGTGSAGAAEIANRYYRKSAAIYEDILRGLTDPGYASMDGNGGGGGGSSSSSSDSNTRRSSSIGSSGSPGGGSSGFTGDTGMLYYGKMSGNDRGGIFAAPTTANDEPERSDGQIARQHLWLLRLALERAGGWSNKGYAEYERLNADVFARYPVEMEGAAGVERWDLAAYGCGRAQSDDDMLRAEELSQWGLMTEAEDEDMN